jgi:MraZ protein
VAERFRDTVTQAVDRTKGQVSVPASFLKVIKAGDPDWAEGRKPRFVVVFSEHLGGCLECYTREAADEITARIDEMQPGSPGRKLLERIFYKKAYEAEVQPDGRIVVPKERRDQIGLVDRAVFVGLGNRFQIWTPERHAEVEAEEASRLEAELQTGVDPMTLLPPRPKG